MTEQWMGQVEVIKKVNPVTVLVAIFPSSEVNN